MRPTSSHWVQPPEKLPLEGPCFSRSSLALLALGLCCVGSKNGQIEGRRMREEHGCLGSRPSGLGRRGK